MSAVVRAMKHSRRRPAEEQPVYHYHDVYEDLAEAIILQAVKDYRISLRRPYSKEWQKVRKSCECFFRSAWFGVLTDVDPELILAGLKKEVAV